MAKATPEVTAWPIYHSESGSTGTTFETVDGAKKRMITGEYRKRRTLPRMDEIEASATAFSRWLYERANLLLDPHPDRALECFRPGGRRRA